MLLKRLVDVRRVAVNTTLPHAFQMQGAAVYHPGILPGMKALKSSWTRSALRRCAFWKTLQGHRSANKKTGSQIAGFFLNGMCP
jgi:hypothetical protein